MINNYEKILFKNVFPKIDNMSNVKCFFEEQLKVAGAPHKVISQVNIAVDEIFSNIVFHGNAGLVRVGCRIIGHKAIFYFKDDGIPYNPTKTPEPDISLPIEKRNIGGLGIYMVRKMMDGMEYFYSDGLNIFVLEKEW